MTIAALTADNHLGDTEPIVEPYRIGSETDSELSWEQAPAKEDSWEESDMMPNAAQPAEMPANGDRGAEAERLPQHQEAPMQDATARDVPMAHEENAQPAEAAPPREPGTWTANRVDQMANDMIDGSSRDKRKARRLPQRSEA